MVQLTIGYAAIGLGLLLVMAATFALANRLTAGQILSDTQRAVVIGGVCGMIVFFAALYVWLT